MTELLAISPPEGKPRFCLRNRLPDRTITAEIAAKSLRKAQTAIREADADNLALVLQGRLTAGDVIAEAGLGAQPKTVTAANLMTRFKNQHGRCGDDPPQEIKHGHDG